MLRNLLQRDGQTVCAKGKGSKEGKETELVYRFEGAHDGNVVLELDSHFLLGERLEHAENEHVCAVTLYPLREEGVPKFPTRHLGSKALINWLYAPMG